MALTIRNVMSMIFSIVILLVSFSCLDGCNGDVLIYANVFVGIEWRWKGRKQRGYKLLEERRHC